MRNDDFIDFGEEISKTVRKVLNNQDFYDLKNTINRTMKNIPGMGGGSFSNGSFSNEDFPHLSKDQRQEPYAYENNYKKSNRKKEKGASFVSSVLFIVFGSIGIAVSSLTLLIGVAIEAAMKNFPVVQAISTIFGVIFVVSWFLFIAGLQLRKRTKRFRLYQKVLNGRSFCMIEELSAASGKSTKFIVKDLRKMIRSELFLEGYLDEQATCLMTDYNTYSQYLQAAKKSEEQKEVKKREDEQWQNLQGGEQLKQTIYEGKNYIKTIKEANDALPEEEISDKLDQLELITTKIFDYVKEHPEKLPEIRKFMCYYMPITLKLVTAYQTFDQHGTNSSEIESTKLEIKGTLDTINKAYLNLLKKLMQADILDVSSDISALETILAQEGLTQDELRDKSKGGN